MHRTIKTATLLLISLFLGATGSALAEQSKDFGDFVVHYNALSTDFLNPATAKAYDKIAAVGLGRLGGRGGSPSGRLRLHAVKNDRGDTSGGENFSSFV